MGSRARRERRTRMVVWGSGNPCTGGPCGGTPVGKTPWKDPLVGGPFRGDPRRLALGGPHALGSATGAERAEKTSRKRAGADVSPKRRQTGATGWRRARGSPVRRLASWIPTEGDWQARLASAAGGRGSTTAAPEGPTAGWNEFAMVWRSSLPLLPLGWLEWPPGSSSDCNGQAWKRLADPKIESRAGSGRDITPNLGAAAASPAARTARKGPRMSPRERIPGQHTP